MAKSNIIKKPSKEQVIATTSTDFCVENFGMTAKELIDICQKLNKLKAMGYDPVEVLQSIIDKFEKEAGHEK